MSNLTIVSIYGLKHIYNIEPVFLVYKSGVLSVLGVFNTKEKAQSFCDNYYIFNKHVYNYRPYEYLNQQTLENIKSICSGNSFKLNHKLKKLKVKYFEDNHTVELKGDISDKKTNDFLENYLSIIIQKIIVSENIDSSIMKNTNNKFIN